MKKLFSLLTLTFLLGLSPAKAEDPVHYDEDIAVHVSGMVCDFCAQSLKKVFGKEDSVNGINVDLDTQMVTIDTKDGKDLSDEKIKELIEWGGYDLISIKRNKS